MKSLLSLIIVLLIVSCGGNSAQQNTEDVQSIPPPQISISCLGDSITSGWLSGASSADYSKSYCNLLTQSARVSFVNNHAVPSKDITQIYNEQLPILLAHPTQIVIIATGYNDSYHNIPLEVFRQKYSSIISLVKAKGSRAFCMTMPESNINVINVTEYNNIVLTMTMSGCTIIPMHSYYKSSWRNAALAAGDLHFSEEAYKEMKDIVLTYIKEN